MGLGIQGHRSSATLGLEGLHDLQRVRSFFMRDGHVALTVRTEGEVGARIERVGIDTLADGDVRQDFPVRGV